MQNKPNILFTSHNFGTISEVWMWRQLMGMKNLQPHLLTWEYSNKDSFPTDRIEIIELKEFDQTPYESKHRWLYRLACLPQFNFYASPRKEYKKISNHIERLRPKAILAQFGFMGLRMVPFAKKK